MDVLVTFGFECLKTPNPNPNPKKTKNNLNLSFYSDGRTVAIKKIQAKTFSLSKTIRQEVKQVR